MIKIFNLPTKIKSFLKEVFIELKKVNWLSRAEILRYTLIIIIISVIVAVFLGGLDYIFTTILSRFIL